MNFLDSFENQWVKLTVNVQQSRQVLSNRVYRLVLMSTSKTMLIAILIISSSENQLSYTWKKQKSIWKDKCVLYTPNEPKLANCFYVEKSRLFIFFWLKRGCNETYYGNDFCFSCHHNQYLKDLFPIEHPFSWHLRKEAFALLSASSHVIKNCEYKDHGDLDRECVGWVLETI